MPISVKHSRHLLVAVLAFLVMAQTGCASGQKRPSQLLPSRSSYRTGPFVIHSHKSMRHKDPVVQELESLSRSVVSHIGKSRQPTEAVVNVYILADEASFKHFLQYYHPELPERRAYFIATANSRSVYTYAGDHLMEDLRHEATHAIVNLTHPGLPLWLDEGLAELFEHPDRDKKPDTHQERFLADIKSGMVPNLAHLESIQDVRQLTPANYRESWAWARWGLEGPTPVRQVFRSYMDDVMRLGAQESPQALKTLAMRWAELPETDKLNPAENHMLAWIQQVPESAQSPSLAGQALADPSIKQTRLQDESQKPDSGKPVHSETLERPSKPTGLGAWLRRIWRR